MRLRPGFAIWQWTLLGLGLVATLGSAAADDRVGSRFPYLDALDPYYPDLATAKLTTPMWVGEEGVDAVMQLSIDDMGRSNSPFKLMALAKSPPFYYQFLQPTIERLQKIDGRAPISIYTLQADGDDPWLQRMMKEGLSIEAHTFSHPVPYFRTDPSGRGESLEWCIRDFLDCVTGLTAAIGRAPAAWRMPGCDARNTTSPRFYTEVFPRRTATGEFLAMDSSIFMVFTSADQTLPRDRVLDAAGRERFGRFVTGIPFTKQFVNTVSNYPYPYVINGLLWELPPIIPGDAHGVHAYQAGSPRVVEDWQRALDLVVANRAFTRSAAIRTATACRSTPPHWWITPTAPTDGACGFSTAGKFSIVSRRISSPARRCARPRARTTACG